MVSVCRAGKRILQKTKYTLYQHPKHSTASPIARIYGPRNQGVKKEIVSFTITPSDPLRKFLLLVPTILNSAGLEVLVPEREMLLPGATKHSIKLETQSFSYSLWASNAL